MKDHPALLWLQAYVVAARHTLPPNAFGETVTYAAVTDPPTETTCGVVLVERPDGELVVQWEHQHPFFFECPPEVLAELSDTSHPLALEWRATCQEALQGEDETEEAPPPLELKPGDTVVFKRSWNIDGHRVYTFTAVNPAKSLFRSPHGEWRLTGWRKRRFSVKRDSGDSKSPENLPEVPLKHMDP